MSWLDGLKHRMRTLLRPGAHTRDLDAEMRFHADLDAANERDPSGSARRLGNRTYYREEVRRLTSLGSLDVLRQDLSYAWRTLRRSPGFTAIVVLTLALGIGANASAFSILDRIYLRTPSGVVDPGALRRMWVEHFRTNTGVPFKSQTISYGAYDAIVKATGTGRQSALYATDFAMRLGKHPTDPKVGVVYATANYFDVLGIRPALGRFYSADEDRLGSGASVVVVSHAFWKNRLHGDPAALGMAIPIGKNVYTVIGVADPAFTGLDLRAAEVWIPLASFPDPGWNRNKPWWTEDAMTWFTVVRRPTPSLADAEYQRRATVAVREMNRALGASGDTLATVWTGPIIEARGPATPGQEMIVSTRLGGVAVIVLLIAAANVINLLLARATSRQREIALRLALGVSRARLIRMLTTETLVLAGLAGAAGLVATWWGASLLRALIMPEVPWTDSALDGRVVAFTIGVTIVAGLVAGVIPAIQATNPQLSSALKTGGRTGARHRSRLRSALVVTQAALSVTLLVGAALFVRSLRNVQSLDTGFDVNQLFFGRVEFADGDAPSRPVLGAAMRDVASRIRGRPGVESVARASWEPMLGLGFLDFFAGADSTASFGRRAPTMVAVSPPFFRTVGLRILRGRSFLGDDAEHTPEVVVNEAMAKLVWPGRDPIGECLRFKTRDNPCFTVVGVIETARLTNIIENEPAAQFYIPLGSSATTSSGATIIVRASTAQVGTASAELAQALRRAFPSAATSVRSMTANLEPEFRPWRLGASLFTALGLLAMIVAVIGIYGTVSYGVTQRTHEFGVRVALGAQVADVVRQVVGEGLRTVAVGITLGVALAIAAGRLVAAMLYGIAPRDPGVLAIVSITLLAAAGLAALVPAWRAARADPLTALRAE